MPGTTLRLAALVLVLLSTLFWPRDGALAGPGSEPAATQTATAQGPLRPPDRPVDASVYLDDRSDAAAVLASYVNALNRHEYLRAYGYWEPEAAASALGPFAQFEQGFADTRSVDLQVGQARSDAGAGQLYYALPVALTSETGGGTQSFVGCYLLHLAQPAIQATPPFRPLAIRSASVRAVPENARLPAPTADDCVPG